MRAIRATKARANLNRLIEEAARSSAPIRIKSNRSNAILVPTSLWRSMKETLHLLSIPQMAESSIPQMAESLREGMKTPLARCRRDPGW
jgi:prevent-host-death family protein